MKKLFNLSFLVLAFVVFALMCSSCKKNLAGGIAESIVGSKYGMVAGNLKNVHTVEFKAGGVFVNQYSGMGNGYQDYFKGTYRVEGKNIICTVTWLNREIGDVPEVGEVLSPYTIYDSTTLHRDGVVWKKM